MLSEGGCPSAVSAPLSDTYSTAAVSAADSCRAGTDEKSYMALQIRAEMRLHLIKMFPFIAPQCAYS